MLLDYICRTRIGNGHHAQGPRGRDYHRVHRHGHPHRQKVRRGAAPHPDRLQVHRRADRLCWKPQGHPERYIFGFEESYGYLSGAHVRDKDAVNAVMLACEDRRLLRRAGHEPAGRCQRSCTGEFGFYRNALDSFTFEGETGMHKMQGIMAGLRTSAPKTIAGYEVAEVVDYDADGTGLPRADVLEYRLVNGAKLMVRPSGTEPKIKVYLSAVANSEEAADAINTAMADAAKDWMK